MFHLWTKNWKRKRLLRKPIPKGWDAILSQSFWYWAVLDPDQRDRLLKLIRIFLHEKEIVVPPQYQDVEYVRLVTAAAACLMLLGFSDWYCFDRVHTVILTAKPFKLQVRDSAVEVLFGTMLASGSYERGAPVAICWPEAAEECANRDLVSNVVIHEFAHHIDDLDGALAGDPPFATRRSMERWRQVIHQEMNLLQRQVDRGETSVLDDYGLTNETEFFAVSCEAFFCQPIELFQGHPELFQLLKELFNLDPRRWLA